MSRLRSMRFQTTLVVIAGFLLSHAVGFLFYSLDRQDALTMTEAIDLAERAAGVSRLVRDMPPSLREDVVLYSDSRIFRVWISSEPVVRTEMENEHELEILNYLRTQVPRISNNEMHVRFVSSQDAERRPPAFDDTNRSGSPASADDTPIDGPSLAISIRHSGTDWINFLGSLGSQKSPILELFFANLASAIVGIGLVAFWLVDRVTGPLGKFSRAAEELGHDLYRPPLSLGGPSEVSTAARAFNRMQSKIVRLIQSRTEFLAGISHDLRTPLTQMRLRLEAMEESVTREKMLRSIDEMNAIIGSFLSYARAVHDMEARSKLDLGAMVSSICDDLEEGGAPVSCEVETGLIVECRRLAMKRALINIIDNAMKYGSRAEVSAFRSPNGVVIRVDDAGPGIPEAEIPKAIKPFKRLTDDRNRDEPSGSGLGLSIAMAIVEDHGGEMTLQNQAPVGLRVEITLPA